MTMTQHPTTSAWCQSCTHPHSRFSARFLHNNQMGEWPRRSTHIWNGRQQLKQRQHISQNLRPNQTRRQRDNTTDDNDANDQPTTHQPTDQPTNQYGKHQHFCQRLFTHTRGAAFICTQEAWGLSCGDRPVRKVESKKKQTAWGGIKVDAAGNGNIFGKRLFTHARWPILYAQTIRSDSVAPH